MNMELTVVFSVVLQNVHIGESTHFDLKSL